MEATQGIIGYKKSKKLDKENTFNNDEISNTAKGKGEPIDVNYLITMLECMLMRMDILAVFQGKGKIKLKKTHA